VYKSLPPSEAAALPSIQTMMLKYNRLQNLLACKISKTTLESLLTSTNGTLISQPEKLQMG